MYNTRIQDGSLTAADTISGLNSSVHFNVRVIFFRVLRVYQTFPSHFPGFRPNGSGKHRYSGYNRIFNNVFSPTTRVADMAEIVRRMIHGCGQPHERKRVVD